MTIEPKTRRIPCSVCVDLASPPQWQRGARRGDGGAVPMATHLLGSHRPGRRVPQQRTHPAAADHVLCGPRHQRDVHGFHRYRCGRDDDRAPGGALRRRVAAHRARHARQADHLVVVRPADADGVGHRPAGGRLLYDVLPRDNPHSAFRGDAQVDGGASPHAIRSHLRQVQPHPRLLAIQHHDELALLPQARRVCVVRARNRSWLERQRPWRPVRGGGARDAASRGERTARARDDALEVLLPPGVLGRAGGAHPTDPRSDVGRRFRHVVRSIRGGHRSYAHKEKARGGRSRIGFVCETSAPWRVPLGVRGRCCSATTRFRQTTVELGGVLRGQAGTRSAHTA
mmetsp:Transcript_5829/g.15172  ORF Transcript_5829/g.15172 Transcript_5829/m.15172 type:complete len:342 (-) Transcript_5829:392-1417(-)